jgi:hypothetical protein
VTVKEFAYGSSWPSIFARIDSEHRQGLKVAKSTMIGMRAGGILEAEYDRVYQDELLDKIREKELVEKREDYQRNAKRLEEAEAKLLGGGDMNPEEDERWLDDYFVAET